MDQHEGRELYLDLLKRSLLNTLYFEGGMRVSYLLMQMDTSQPYDLDHILHIDKHEPKVYASLREDAACRENYRERIFGFPMTMIGRKRLENVEFCLRQIIADGIGGDCMETGVWRGGCTIFMRGMLKAFGVEDKDVWVADSFEGVPKPSHNEDVGTDLYLDPNLAVSVEEVQENFRRFDLLDDKVRFLEGWFEETMAGAPVEKLSLLRLDGDLYSSTITVLDNMYDKVVEGGYVIIDDYGALEPCRKAVNDFRAQRNITAPIEDVDWTGAFWRKES